MLAAASLCVSKQNVGEPFSSLTETLIVSEVWFVAGGVTAGVGLQHAQCVSGGGGDDIGS